MKKSLSEMTLEELWTLFPIFLTEHNKNWKEWFAEEQTFLTSVFLKEQVQAIHHIGSTAVDGIWAKPIIDILVEVNSESSFPNLKSLLIKANYLCMSEGMSEGKYRLAFNKGYTESGFAQKVYHLHLRLVGDHDELYFRDYLNKYPSIAKEYEALKLSLWKQYAHNRDAYTEMKTTFVKEQTEKAKVELGFIPL